MGSTTMRSNDFSITTCSNARMRRRDGESTASLGHLLVLLPDTKMSRYQPPDDLTKFLQAL
jgi:hypothetical protein